MYINSKICIYSLYKQVITYLILVVRLVYYMCWVKQKIKYEGLNKNLFKLKLKIKNLNLKVNILNTKYEL